MSKRFLYEAYIRVKQKKGSPGIDGETFEIIESKGINEFIDELHNDLKRKSYIPSPVLRVNIPKWNGKTRPLGIPTIRDRVVQMSCKIVIEPIFEADFEGSSYGVRPKRGASGAIKEIRKNIKEGKQEILDADLSSYFDTIPHTKLMKLVGRRISDKHVLRLIKKFLKAPVKDEDNNLSGGKKNKVGTPQGGVISPLLANIYLDMLDKMVKVLEQFKNYGIKIVRYADDFVLMGKKIPEDVTKELKEILEKMELKLNTDKTHKVNIRDESFDFLGFTFRRDKSLYNSQEKYLNIVPSKKSEKKIREKIDEYLKNNGHLPPEIVSIDINMKVRGWINYHTIEGISYPNKAKRNLRWYLFQKLSRYYKRKSQRASKLYSKGAYKILVNKYGLIEPTAY
ncbi:group II intron reverse transcriptase/maturase [Haliovirga abyssi]|nr:group II intron reverse transcriptase/maturase [Haliovirga abyssi]